MTRVDRHHQSGRLDAEAGMTSERAGSLAGETLHVKDALSVLEDSREEITMHHSEKMEAKDFAEREVEGEPPANVLRVEHVEAYLEATRRFRDPKVLADIVKLMQDNARPRDVARGHARSPALQFALLQRALAEAIKGGASPEAIERLQEAVDSLEHEAGPLIRAGLNTAEAASGFEPTSEGVENFQQAYTDIVLGQQTFAETLQVVLERLSGTQGEDFPRGLRSLLQALGADMSAARPSIDPRRLQALVQDVYQLELAGTVLEGCTRLCESLAARFGGTGVEPLALMRELVALTQERWIVPGRLQAMAARFQMTALQQRIAFHTGNKTVLRKMPVKVFQDEDARQAVLRCTQQVLDESIAEEEEGQQG